ncbi:MAG: UDP-N-acetylmuramoyl-tripeptide--D-alanyl-D-alanine ligase [Patescibacteria group bacterium]
MKNTAKKIIIYILTLEAKQVLKKYKPKIVAVTGSVGKTSTKDAIYAALLPFAHVRKSAKSFNSDIGIPLTILGLPNAWSDSSKWLLNIWRGFLLLIKKSAYPEWLVLEIGADHPGEIERVMHWVHPDISVITRIGGVPVHVENYRSVKEVIKEKSFLARGLKKDGFLILNSDDDDVMGFKEYTNAKVLTFGITSSADVQGTYIQPLYSEDGKVAGTSFKADIDGSSIPITLKNILGKTHVYPVLASFAIVKALNLNPLEAKQAFADYDYPKGRMNIIDGLHNSKIIDDTYNASPVAMEEALRSVEELKVSGRKIGVLGDMLELGKYSSEEHMKLGEFAGKIFDVLVLVGIRAKEMQAPAHKAGKKKSAIHAFDNSADAGQFLLGFVGEGDLVFVKGSQGMRMEKVVEKIIAFPEFKSKLLVRQEAEWSRR